MVNQAEPSSGPAAAAYSRRRAGLGARRPLPRPLRARYRNTGARRLREKPAWNQCGRMDASPDEFAVGQVDKAINAPTSPEACAARLDRRRPAALPEPRPAPPARATSWPTTPTPVPPPGTCCGRESASAGTEAGQRPDRRRENQQPVEQIEEKRLFLLKVTRSRSDDHVAPSCCSPRDRICAADDAQPQGQGRRPGPTSPVTSRSFRRNDLPEAHPRTSCWRGNSERLEQPRPRRSARRRRPGEPFAASPGCPWTSSRSDAPGSGAKARPGAFAAAMKP